MTLRPYIQCLIYLVFFHTQTRATTVQCALQMQQQLGMIDVGLDKGLASRLKVLILLTIIISRSFMAEN